MILEDGTGSGNKAKVNDHNQLYTSAVIRTEISEVSLDEGEAYVLATGFISITTTAGFSGILYIKNTDSQGRDMFIEHIRLCGTLSGTMDMHDIQCKVIKNPTTGTLISGASAGYSENSNFGSANSFHGICYKGADSTTVTDGSWFTQFTTHIPGHTIADYNDAIILPKNKSVAFLVKPTIASEVCMEVNVHFK